MRKIILLTLLSFLFGTGFPNTGNKNEIKKAGIKVLGECGMCKSRIEKAAKVEGVTSAVWNRETKVLQVEYHTSKIKIEFIHRNIARVGHDTHKEKAYDAVYNALPSCCKYQRNIDYKEQKK